MDDLSNKESGNSTPTTSKKALEINIQEHTESIKDNIDLAIDKCDGMTKIQIEVNGEEKEIWYDNENLKVDSNNWEEIKIVGDLVKINSEKNILQIMKGKQAGEQLFTWDTGKREIEKRGKRLPTSEELKAIISKIGPAEFMKNYIGFWNNNNLYLGYLGLNRGSDFWTNSESGGKNYAALSIHLSSDINIRRNCIFKEWLDKDSYGLSVRGVKD